MQVLCNLVPFNLPQFVDPAVLGFQQLCLFIGSGLPLLVHVVDHGRLLEVPLRIFDQLQVLLVSVSQFIIRILQDVPFELPQTFELQLHAINRVVDFVHLVNAFGHLVA